MKQRRTAAHVPPSDEPSPRGVEQLLAAIATALLVLAALVPSESVTRGTGVTWAALWMVVLSASSVLSLYRRRTVALGLVDAAVLLLGMWIVLSAGLRAWQGEPRATWNAAWHWLAILAGFWVVRQLWQAPASRRALLAVMLAVSGGLAAHGLHQFAVTMPRYRADYEQADETSKRRMLLENGFDPDPAMPQRRHFEDRLKSTEPYATFGLANSLAGVLAAWWIVLIWLQLTPEVTRMSAARRAALAAVSLIILACLVLTKSRAAWLATAAGFAVTCAAHRQAIVRHRGWLGAGAAALLVILAAGAWLGALDRQILTEARISITYRFEYWRGATAMALDYPLFGCGPGNFQDYYTQYKLPAASETVADPHQLFLEVAATAGFPALAALLLVLAGAARTLWKSRGNHPAAAEPGPAAATPAAIYGGALLGALLAVPYGVLIEIPPEFSPHLGLPVVWVIGVPVAACVLYLLHPWVQGSQACISAMSATAFLVITTNLLAAGGISYAGVALTWWLALALMLDVRFSSAPLAHRRGVALALGAGLLLAGNLLTGYLPVMRAQTAVRRAVAARTAGQALDAYQQAAEADGWAAEPRRLAAELLLMEWLRESDAETYRQFEAQLEEAAERSRHSHSFAMMCGRLYLQSYRSGRQPADLDKSLAWYQRAVALYPNSNYAHAQLAWVAHLRGRAALAAAHAHTALELDAINPHAEQQLRRRRLIDPGPSPGREGQLPAPAEGVRAEPLMRQLRTGVQGDQGGTLRAAKGNL